MNVAHTHFTPVVLCNRGDDTQRKNDLMSQTGTTTSTEYVLGDICPRTVFQTQQVSHVHIMLTAVEAVETSTIILSRVLHRDAPYPWRRYSAENKTGLNSRKG